MDILLQQSRKVQHIKHALELPDGPQQTGFDDIQLLHNCLPELAFSDIDLTSNIASVSLPHPIIINAMTGGHDSLTAINRQLAIAAKRTGSAMAVGSQSIALKDQSSKKSFTVVRENNSDGVIFANIGAYATPRQAKEVVQMLDAQALQIHLNTAQEIFMREGDRDFRGYLDNIRKIAENINVPVIVKETGCGIAMEQADKLMAAGIKVIDISGGGGSNFLAIEMARHQKESASTGFLSWGIPTAASALEIAAISRNRADMIVSGGIRRALDIVKALACGGQAVGVAVLFLRLLQDKNAENVVAKKITDLLEETKKFMLLAGAANIRQLREKPLIITGKTREWLIARGISVER